MKPNRSFVRLLFLLLFTAQETVGQLPWPVTPITQIKRLYAGYGTYDDNSPANSGVHLHEGLDILVDSGTRVVASEAGRAVFVQGAHGYAGAVFVSRRSNANEALCYIHIRVVNNPRTGRQWAVNDSVYLGDTVGTVFPHPVFPAHLHFDWRRKEAAEPWVFYMAPLVPAPAVTNLLPEFNGNPIDLLTPLADPATNRPAFSNPICYRTHTGSSYFTSTIRSGDTVINGNVDFVARIKETFGPAGTTSYNIGPKRIQWSVQEYKPGTTAQIATQTPVDFTGRFLQQEPHHDYNVITRPNIGPVTNTAVPMPAGVGTGRNAHWKFYWNLMGGDNNATYEARFGDLIYTLYSRDAVCRSVPRNILGPDDGVFWYILTNIDTTNNLIESRDSAYFWDTNGREGQRWNDIRDDAPNEADSNKTAAFPDGRYILTLTARGYGDVNDATTRRDTVSINNFNEYIYSCSANGTLKDTFCIGDPVYIKGVGFPKSRSFRVFVIKNRNWPDSTFIPNDASRVAAATVTSDANGWIRPVRIWNAYAANGTPDAGYDIVLDYNADSVYSTNRLNCTIDVLDEQPGPFGIISAMPKIQKSKTDVKCYGKCTGSITITVTGGRPPYTYTWNDGKGANKSFRDSLCAGKYWVTVTDANGCTVSDTTIITQPGTPLKASGMSANSRCGLCNGLATVSASGGTPPYTYNWPNGTLSNLCAGTYMGIVWDANGCSDTIAIPVYETPTTLSLSGSSTPASCNVCNGSATLTASGGTPPYTYSWANGTLTNVCAGIYTGIVWDIYGCSDTVQVVVGTTPSTLNLSGSSTPASCGQCNGSATLTASGGTPPYTYSWANGTLTNVCAGTYTGIVWDIYGCSDTVNITVPQNNSSLMLNCSATPANCGQCNGSVSFSASGGAPPYTYSWPGGSMNNLCAGSYTGSVTDANGCTASCSAVVYETGSTLSVNCYTTGAHCDSCNGSASLSAFGGTPPYTYSWPGGVLNNLCSGSYYGTVADATGCSVSCLAYVYPVFDYCDTIRTDTLKHDTIALKLPGTGIAFTGVQAFPNPFSEYMQLRFYSKQAGNATVSVQTAEGIIVRRLKLPVMKGVNAVTLNGQNLASGIYFIKLVMQGTVVIKVYRH